MKLVDIGMGNFEKKSRSARCRSGFMNVKGADALFFEPFHRFERVLTASKG